MNATSEKDYDYKEILSLYNQISQKDTTFIKSLAILNYVNLPNRTTPDLFQAQCYILALVSFLNSKGFVIKKEDNNE